MIKTICKRAIKIFKKERSFFIHKSVIIWGKKNLIMRNNSKIWEYVIIRSEPGILELGENSRIGPFSVLFTGDLGIIIGKNVMISPHCVIAAGSHNYKQVEIPMLFAGNICNGKIIIQDDVWIGANSVITDGVIIGMGAVIGAGSIVNKDVKPYDIVAGNPAIIIGNRKEKYS